MKIIENNGKLYVEAEAQWELLTGLVTTTIDGINFCYLHPTTPLGKVLVEVEKMHHNSHDLVGHYVPVLKDGMGQVYDAAEFREKQEQHNQDLTHQLKNQTKMTRRRKVLWSLLR